MKQNLTHWARLGAAQRLRELDQERAAIFAEFPELRRARPGALAPGGASPIAAPRFKKKRKFSEEAKKRMSEGMRKYWARRKAAAKTAKGAKGS